MKETGPGAVTSEKLISTGGDLVLQTILSMELSLQFLGPLQGFEIEKASESGRERLSGGGRSLLRTLLRVEFPANRENYREICEFGPHFWQQDCSIVLNLGEL